MSHAISDREFLSLHHAANQSCGFAIQKVRTVKNMTMSFASDCKIINSIVVEQAHRFASPARIIPIRKVKMIPKSSFEDQVVIKGNQCWTSSLNLIVK